MLGQYLIRLSAYDFGTACHEGGNSGDAVPAGLLPVGIDSILESALVQHGSRLLDRKPDRLCDIKENFSLAEVAAVDEISLIERVVNVFESALRVRPFREFLGKPAVVSMRAAIIRKAFGIHQSLHARVHGFEVQPASGEQILKGKTFCRCVGMQREIYPLEINVVVPLQPFNTPGTEVAPGSNEVGEDFESNGISHCLLL